VLRLRITGPYTDNLTLVLVTVISKTCTVCKGKSPTICRIYQQP
jgi:hypothetical protein